MRPTLNDTYRDSVKQFTNKEQINCKEYKKRSSSTTHGPLSAEQRQQETRHNSTKYCKRRTKAAANYTNPIRTTDLDTAPAELT